MGGCSLCLNPATSLQFQKLGMLSPDARCKAFDVSGNGYVRSEAVVAIYIQREHLAKRVYATAIHSKSNSDGSKKEGITFPSGEVQARLLREVYSEAGVDPSEVSYVEAHGTGTKVGDPQELNSIVDVFCKNRNDPLMIGSTKSNMGHPEPASGLSSVTKVLIAMEDGQIPANLHFNEPNPDIPGLNDGRLKVISERTKWDGGYVGINSFGFGGSNVHVLLKSAPRDKKPLHPASSVPRLITLSGRSADGVKKGLEKLKENAENVELQALVQQNANAPGQSFRGFTLVNTGGELLEVQKKTEEERPVWFIFPGMGTQWHGMGKDLMQLKVFHDSIMNSEVALKPYGISIYDIIMNGNKDTFENTKNSFVGIAAIQVALVDVLKALGMEPAGIVGHSVGELACAYADGGLTAQETVLAAYMRGKCITEAKLPPGSMAAVGLTWEEAKRRCPAGVVAACHNSEDTQTISGPADEVAKFVAELKAEDIFAKEVKSSGVAFHSPFMASIAPSLKVALQKVIKEKRPRTSRWISSSIPEAGWGSELSKFSSAEYHVNNLVSPVLFQEALKHVPTNAITVEIAPHCLLQAVLKRSLGPKCSFISMMKRDHVNNMEFLLSNMGKFYMAGGNLNPLGLHPSVTYPVSHGTPSVSTLVSESWDHSQQWQVPTVDEFKAGGGDSQAGCSFEIDADPESDDHYLVGHKIDGRVLFPASGYLVLVWKALAKMSGFVYTDIPVTFEDVQIHRATVLPTKGSVKLEVAIMAASGMFEVCEAGAQVVTGKVTLPVQPTPAIPVSESPADGCIRLTAADVYKELRLRGYDYGPTFQGIASTSNSGQEGQLKWLNNWVSFLDAMLQIQVLSLPGRSLRLPTRIKRLTIDPSLQKEQVREGESGEEVKVVVDRALDSCSAGGVQIFGLHATVAPRRQKQQAAPTLERFSFSPYFEDNSDMVDSMKTCLDIVMENCGGHKMRIVEIVADTPVCKQVTSLLHSQPLLTTDYTIAGPALQDLPEEILTDVTTVAWDLKSSFPASASSPELLLIGAEQVKQNIVKMLDSLISKRCFVMVHGQNVTDCVDVCKAEGLLVLAQKTGGGSGVLLLRAPTDVKVNPTIVEVDNADFTWAETIKDAMAKVSSPADRVYLVSKNDNANGVIGMVNCLRQEEGGVALRCIFDASLGSGKAMPSVTPTTVTENDLVMNVFREGKWGSFRHLPISSQAPLMDTQHAYVNVLTRGDLASLKWIQSPTKHLSTTNYQDKSLCKVFNTSLNFRDIMLATGKLPPDALPGDMASQDCILGMEISGTDDSGRRVMGLLPAQGLATTVAVDKRFLWPVPDNWTLEEAATVPVVYTTAYYALVLRGNLRRGETVLIHSGSGGVGQAAIAIALHYGCQVFTTVGSQEKREYLKKRFPQLNDASFCNSRDTSFEWDILRATNGKGVNLILNSLAEEKLQSSVRLLAPHGRFLEIGKYDLSNNSPLGMAVFLKNVRFYSTNLFSKYSWYLFY